MKQLHQNLYVAGQIQAQDFPALQEAGIKIIINNRPDGEQPGQLEQHTAAQLAEQHDMQYHYLPMANGQPLPETLVEDFKQVLDSSEDKILAHCRSGMRSSFIWALGQIADGALTPDQTIAAAANAGIALHSARVALENAAS